MLSELLREMRCAHCGTRFELRLYRRAGEPRVEIDSSCPVCVRGTDKPGPTVADVAKQRLDD